LKFEIRIHGRWQSETILIAACALRRMPIKRSQHPTDVGLSPQRSIFDFFGLTNESSGGLGATSSAAKVVVVAEVWAQWSTKTDCRTLKSSFKWF